MSVYAPKMIGFDGADRLVSLAAATVSITEANHEGRALVFNKADGVTATLPSATGSGAVYRFIVGTTVTSNALIIKVAAAADTMAGIIYAADDTSGPAPIVWVATTGTSDTVNLNGSTQGGIIGDEIICTDYAANKWLVRGFVKQSGTEATPFANTVS